MENQTPNFDVDKLDIPKKALLNSLISASIGLVPGGGFIVEGFNYYGKVKQERLNLFLEKFKEYLESCSENEISEEFFKSEDFQGLFELIIKKVAEAKSESRRETFRKILINSIEAKKVSDFSETFLNLTSQLQEKQIEILNIYHDTIVEYNRMSKEIYEFNEQNTELLNRNAVDIAKGISIDTRQVVETRNKMLEERKIKVRSLNNHDCFDMGKFEFEFYLQDLASKCLLRDVRGDGMGDNDSPNYGVTLLGENYLNFLKA